MKCPDCQCEMALVDKNTVTGEDIREYYCQACDRTETENRGKALWEILSDAREWLDQQKKK